MRRINDIFYSLQGEGRHTGRAAIFLRFAGCNRSCSFCDTLFDSYEEMTDEEILHRISSYASRFVVLTGGEPTLQVDESFIDLLHQHGYEVAMETNGSNPLPRNLDWSTVSPKGKTVVTRCNELKVIFTAQDQQQFSSLQLNPQGIVADYYYLQPCDTGDSERNQAIITACIAYIQQHPQWRLSLQTHKLIGFK